MAVVRTCSKRWQSYCQLLKNYTHVNLPMPLRAFQTSEGEHNPGVNSRLTARAALRYCESRLQDAPDGWALLLEDDVTLHPASVANLPALLEIGASEAVDCWYLCNRDTAVSNQFHRSGLVINELAYPIMGSHALLIPKRHLARLLATHWYRTVDTEIFAALAPIQPRIWQVVDPVLVEHRGEFSTFNPLKRQILKVNYANSSNTHPA